MNPAENILDQLRRYESRNVTYVAPDGSWPIVWERARGVEVWDVNGRKYLDLTAAFGVAAAGHANPRVVRAGRLQMGRLLHAMGDVHPHPLKGRLARELSRLTFGRWPAGPPSQPEARRGKTIFGNSGFEAVEAALKSARLGTGKPGVLAFAGAYHGLGYGTLNTTHRDLFRGPFRDQLAEFGYFVDFPLRPADLARLEREMGRLLQRHPIGAVLAEPVQGRAGIRVPPRGFLGLLRRLCDRHGAWLILDEIYTGFGRTGRWFACEHEGVRPDVICLGKALTGGFPLSAAVGRADLMDAAWPDSAGEAMHTSTFLGHPVGCAMALAHLQELRRRRLPLQAGRTGGYLLDQLRRRLAETPLPVQATVRGLGLMVGVELRRRDGAPASRECLEVVKRMLRAGYLLLPEGEFGSVLSLTPPLTISRTGLQRALRALFHILQGLEAP